MSQKKALRLIDANFNRLKEGLRVCEDVFRFIYDDDLLTRKFKSARHQCSKILLAFPVSYRTLVLSRDSISDVGKDSVILEKKKTVWKDVVISNLKRSQEALRVLEETSKVISPATSKKFQSLRFDLYELEKRAIKKL